MINEIFQIKFKIGWFYKNEWFFNNVYVYFNDNQKNQILKRNKFIGKMKVDEN